MGEVKERVLKILKNKFREFVSGEDMAWEMGISRTAIWKHVKELQEEGYTVESSSRKGYRLVGVPDLLFPPALRKGLEGCLVGSQIEYLKEIPSTNDHAKELAKQGAPEGTVVISEVQVEGKGRMDRDWISPKGGLWMSVILRPQLAPNEAQGITLLVGVALARVLNRSYVGCSIKWPNDIYVGGKKVAGILTEMEAEMDGINYVVVGMGVNVNFSVDALPKDLQEGATTIMDEKGEMVHRTDMARDILRELDKVYADFNSGLLPELLGEWKELSSTIGQRVKVLTRKEPIVGEAVAISKEGALIVEKDDGTMEKVIAGECIHLRPNEEG